MKKKRYEKPTCKVYELQHRTMLLVGSSPDAPNYGDWLTYNPHMPHMGTGVV